MRLTRVQPDCYAEEILLTSLGEIAAAEASSVDGGGDNDDEELDAIRREGS